MDTLFLGGGLRFKIIRNNIPRSVEGKKKLRQQFPGVKADWGRRDRTPGFATNLILLFDHEKRTKENDSASFLLWGYINDLPERKSNQLFYYTGTRLDSTVRTFDHYHYNVVSHYNSEGLERKRVYADTLVFSFSHVLDKKYRGPEYFRSKAH